MTKCRCCQQPLDVWVPPTEQFCSPECEAIVTDPIHSEMAKTYAVDEFAELELMDRYARATL